MEWGAEDELLRALDGLRLVIILYLAVVKPYLHIQSEMAARRAGWRFVVCHVFGVFDALLAALVFVNFQARWTKVLPDFDFDAAAGSAAAAAATPPQLAATAATQYANGLVLEGCVLILGVAQLSSCFLKFSEHLFLYWKFALKCFRDYALFLAIALPLFLGFCRLGTHVFGPHVASFSDFGRSTLTLFLFVLGDAPDGLSELLSARAEVPGTRAWAIGFLSSFFLVVVFILANGLLAIVCFNWLAANWRYTRAGFDHSAEQSSKFHSLTFCYARNRIECNRGRLSDPDHAGAGSGSSDATMGGVASRPPRDAKLRSVEDVMRFALWDFLFRRAYPDSVTRA